AREADPSPQPGWTCRCPASTAISSRFAGQEAPSPELTRFAAPYPGPARGSEPARTHSEQSIRGCAAATLLYSTLVSYQKAFSPLYKVTALRLQSRLTIC